MLCNNAVLGVLRFKVQLSMLRNQQSTDRKPSPTLLLIPAERSPQKEPIVTTMTHTQSNVTWAEQNRDQCGQREAIIKEVKGGEKETTVFFIVWGGFWLEDGIHRWDPSAVFISTVWLSSSLSYNSPKINTHLFFSSLFFSHNTSLVCRLHDEPLFPYLSLSVPSLSSQGSFTAMTVKTAVAPKSRCHRLTAPQCFQRDGYKSGAGGQAP